jgi:N-acyl homoserine lactone hydrolase
MPKVFLLKMGSIIRDDAGTILDARSSVTLVVTETVKIIVDTGLKGEEIQIIEALAKIGIVPENIDILVNTHSHPDHCGNNYLFLNAKLLHPKDSEILAPGVRVIETPGHTMDSISVIVDTSAVYSSYDQNYKFIINGNQAKTSFIAIAGDALPTFNNFIKNVPPALHVNRDLAISSMSKIIDIAELVIPGHDLPFSISGRRYIKLSN